MIFKYRKKSLIMDRHVVYLNECAQQTHAGAGDQCQINLANVNTHRFPSRLNSFSFIRILVKGAKLGFIQLLARLHRLSARQWHPWSRAWNSVQAKAYFRHWKRMAVKVTRAGDMQCEQSLVNWSLCIKGCQVMWKVTNRLFHHPAEKNWIIVLNLAPFPSSDWRCWKWVWR